MNGDNNEKLGFCAGFLTTVSFAPQVYTVWKMRPLPAISVSLLMYLVISVGIAL